MTVLVAAVVVGAGIFYVDRLGDEGAVTGALAAPDARTYAAATSQLAIINLDDGTRVTLTPGLDAADREWAGDAGLSVEPVSLQELVVRTTTAPRPEREVA